MSAMLADPVEMIRRGAPRLIRNDEELTEYTRALFDLTAKAEPTGDEREAIELMTLLIERYEQVHYPVPEAEPADVLRYLLERNGLSQRDIIPELGSESTVSLVLSGKRKLNRDHIAALSLHFKISPAVFFGEKLPLHEAIRNVLTERESRTATTQEISEEIERRGLYSRRDGYSPKAKQINARVRWHPDLFQFTAPGVVQLLSDEASASGIR